MANKGFSIHVRRPARITALLSPSHSRGGIPVSFQGVFPSKWDVSFPLQTKGGFLVSSVMKGGTIRFVEIISQFGGDCRIRTPLPSEETTLFSGLPGMLECEGCRITDNK